MTSGIELLNVIWLHNITKAWLYSLNRIKYGLRLKSYLKTILTKFFKNPVNHCPRCNISIRSCNMPISGNNLKTYLDSNVDQNWPDPAITRKFRLWFLVFQASASLLRVLGAVFQCRNSGRSLFWSEPLLLRHIDSFAILKVRRRTCGYELASSGLHPLGVCLVESCWYYWFQK